MSEHITNEQYVASVRKQVVETAQAMIDGSLGFLEGARTLRNLSHEAGVREDDNDFMAFVVIESETDELPIGSVRQHWPKDVLEKLESEYQKAETWAKGIGLHACESLVQRFSR